MTRVGKARRDIFTAHADAISKVNAVLRPMKKKLWRVSELDGLRLTKLLGWSYQYSVSLEYILKTLLPVLAKTVERRTGRRNKSGLGVTVSVLVGDVARSILLEKIAKEYSGSENVYDVLEERKNEMLLKLDEDGNGKPRNPLLYKHPWMFTKAYKAAIQRKRKEREELEDKIASMPFRTNPFR